MSQKSQKRANKKNSAPDTQTDQTLVEMPPADTAGPHGNMSALCLLEEIIKLNKDPRLEELLNTLKSLIPHEGGKLLEDEKRSRSIVISGLGEEFHVSEKPSERQKKLEGQVTQILDVLDVECRPVEIYRMGRRDENRPRLVKVVLPSASHFRVILAKARELRHRGFTHIFIRRSMTREERQREFELRQQARERNSLCVLQNCRIPPTQSRDTDKHAR